MRITESRLQHWKQLSETPGVVVMMSGRIRDAVDFVWPYWSTGTPFPVCLAMLAYANLLDERFYEVGVDYDT